MKSELTVSAKSWEDMVFEHRNKEYGAYSIRKRYAKHVLLATIFAFLIFAFAMAYPTIAEFFKSQEVAEEKPTLRTVTVLDQPPPINPDTPPPPKLDIPPPVKTIIKFLPPKVTDKEIVEEEKMPTVEEIKQNDTGAENVEGTGDVVFEEPVKEVAKEEGDPNQVFVVVEQMPEFEGGVAAMMKFIQKNLKYPASARRMGVEGQVFVQFVIDNDGKVTEVQTMKGVSADCDKEAMRVISMMPRWKPGKQSGKPVRVRYVLPIKFKIAD